MGNLNILPSEILTDILSRLPTESVLECKLVCKPWKNLACDPSFCQIHLTHLSHSGRLTFFTPTRQYHSQQHDQFHYLEYNHNHDETPIHSITRMNITLLPFEKYNIIGSCNGLICLHASYGRGGTCDFHAYICNPITKEYIILPKVCKTRFIYSGFGYLPKTNEYTVVRIDDSRGKDSPVCVEVYSLGSGNGWRNVRDHGLICSDICFFYSYFGVFASDAIHWITNEGNIVAFNLADEKFYELSTMPCLSPDDKRGLYDNIGVLNGILCCSVTQYSASRTDIWLLKKKKGYQNVMEQEKYLSLTWNDMSVSRMKPLSLMKNGEVLFYSRTHLYSYNVKSSSLKTLVSIPECAHRIIPHMNTFVSLKALGEIDTKTWQKKRISRR